MEIIRVQLPTSIARLTPASTTTNDGTEPSLKLNQETQRNRSPTKPVFRRAFYCGLVSAGAAGAGFIGPMPW